MKKINTLTKVFFASFLIFTCVFLRPSDAHAAVRCESQYGGGEVCTRTGELQVDKKVWNVNSNSFVDNMGLSDHVFVAGEEVTFKLKVKMLVIKHLHTFM